MRRADNLTVFIFRFSGTSGNLNLLEHSGPVRPCHRDCFTFIQPSEDAQSVRLPYLPVSEAGPAAKTSVFLLFFFVKFDVGHLYKRLPKKRRFHEIG